MQILVLYSTQEGHTAKIAKRLADNFENQGNEVFLTVTSDPGYCDPGTFDAAVLCAPIHMGSYPTDFIEYIKNWRTSFSKTPNVLVTSSLLIACGNDAEQKEAKGYPAALTTETGWTPDRVYNVAGSLNYPEYDFFKRWIMKRAAKAEKLPVDTNAEHDLTDWVGLDTFADEFVKLIKTEVG